MTSRSAVRNMNVRKKALSERTPVYKPAFSLKVNALKVVSFLLIGAFTLFVLNLVTIYFDKVLELNGGMVGAMAYYFDASREQSIPTLFSSLLLFIASILLLAIFFLNTNASKKSAGWRLLCIVFFFLLLDEATAIHEQLNRLRIYMPDESGYLFYAWIVPYAVLVILFAAVMFRFIARLPVRIRNMMILAGIVYVSAAIGFEVLEGRSAKQDGVGNMQDALLTAIEEFFEMLGIIIFIHALFRYMAAFDFSILIAPQKTNENPSTAH